MIGKYSPRRPAIVIELAERLKQMSKSFPTTRAAWCLHKRQTKCRFTCFLSLPKSDKPGFSYLIVCLSNPPVFRRL
jgi:hypothetical protein